MDKEKELIQKFVEDMREISDINVVTVNLFIAYGGYKLEKEIKDTGYFDMSGKEEYNIKGCSSSCYE